MKFKTGFIVGAALGYYYGAKAGRERYEQLDRKLERVRRLSAYQSTAEAVSDRLGQVQTMAKEKVGSFAGDTLDSILPKSSETEFEPGLEFNPDYRPTEEEMAEDFGNASTWNPPSPSAPVTPG